MTGDDSPVEVARQVPRRRAPAALRWLFAPSDGPSALWPRWIWLRLLGLLFFSAFLALWFQIEGLIGPRGILPAQELLQAAREQIPGPLRFFYVPSLFWLGAGAGALKAAAGAGLCSSLLLTLNWWPRATTLACTALFMSFVAAARDFSGYQSDGMLLEAGLLSAFFAPPGLRPGLGEAHPPSRMSRFLLLWEWLRIYFGSGVVKLLSGDPQWRSLTALDHYYENGPLPTWLGWYAQQLPPLWFHHASAAVVLVVELVAPWVMFLSLRFRRWAFALLTPFQIAIILTANYAFLNYLVLSLGVLLLDDGALQKVSSVFRLPSSAPAQRSVSIAQAVLLSWFFLATVPLLHVLPPSALPAPLLWPARSLAPFRVANSYGLFAVMTEDRYELELQGSRDGERWTPYSFRFKPQEVHEAPGIYAPYQPRLDWNLWFASLGELREYPWVLRLQERLLEGEPSVLRLFARDPFAGAPPRYVRCVRWQYWFTTPEQKRRDSAWWRRELLGPWAPTLERSSDGSVRVVR
jgi:hypothetical protein